jgi:hypothetical protein
MTTTICEPKASANGSTRAALQQNGQDVEWKALVKTSMPWQPNSYDIDSNTLDFCFRPTAELIAFVSSLEAEILTQVAKEAEKYFGSPRTPGAVQSTFQSALKISQKGTEHFKCKGRYSNIKFWDKNQKPTKEPTVWGSDDEYKIVLRAGALWFNDKGGWGISYDLRHLQIFAADCPF